MADKCPACGAKLRHKTDYCEYFECGSKFPVDFSCTQSDECKERERLADEEGVSVYHKDGKTYIPQTTNNGCAGCDLYNGRQCGERNFCASGDRTDRREVIWKISQ